LADLLGERSERRSARGAESRQLGIDRSAGLAAIQLLKRLPQKRVASPPQRWCVQVGATLPMDTGSHSAMSAGVLRDATSTGSALALGAS